MFANLFQTLEYKGSGTMKEKETYMRNDGELCCFKCGEVVEKRILVGTKVYNVRCSCKCDKEAHKKRMEAERQAEIDRNRNSCFSSHDKYRKCKLEDCELNATLTTIATNFCKNFHEFKKQGKGLMFYGSTGTGKTYLASAIANAIIDAGYRVLLTNNTRIVNQIQGTFDEKNSTLDSLNRYDLLIIDDFGIERKSEYMQEMVYNIIDSRYQTGKPLIITTNLNIDVFTKATELTDKRIYERVLEMCMPIRVDGINQRTNRLNEGYVSTRKLLGV